jgi:general transcription factor 3C polypeptide 5 (transcription factor C subunit 1)
MTGLMQSITSKSHIFDGTTLSKETAAFQLCDIHDPMLKEMIDDDETLREVCDVSR